MYIDIVSEWCYNNDNDTMSECNQGVILMKQSIDTGLALYPTPVRPVLFEFPNYQYLRTGDVTGKCLRFKNNIEYGG